MNYKELIYYTVAGAILGLAFPFWQMVAVVLAVMFFRLGDSQ